MQKRDTAHCWRQQALRKPHARAALLRNISRMGRIDGHRRAARRAQPSLPADGKRARHD